MAQSLNVIQWRVGSNGNEFADIGGFRYCVDYPNRKESVFRVLRNGIEIAGPTCLSGPAGFRTGAAAKSYAEQYAKLHAGQCA